MDLPQKIKAGFGNIVMDEKSHTYTLDSKPLNKSVSTQIKDFYVPFNAEKQAPYTAIRLGITPEEVLNQWKESGDEAKDRGHRVHTFAENYVWDRTLIPSCPQEQAVVKFWDELPAYIQPVCVEAMMYHFDYAFPGTADSIFLDLRDGTVILGDYKTNKDLFKNYKGKLMLSPFSHLLDSPFNHYQIQLSFYQIMLEQLGLRISGRKIIWLELDGNYKMWDTEDYTDTLKEHLKNKYENN